MATWLLTYDLDNHDVPDGIFVALFAQKPQELHLRFHGVPDQCIADLLAKGAASRSYCTWNLSEVEPEAI